jgi:hypothetical protein
VSEAGAVDVGSVLDGSRRLDVRDSNGYDTSITDAGVLRDAKDGGIDPNAKDAIGDRLAMDIVSKRDGSLDGKRDGSLDVLADAHLDTARYRGTCDSPVPIPHYLSHSDFSVSTANADHILDFPCAGNGGDIVFKIQSNQPEMVYADTFGASWNTALFFTDTCDSPDPPKGPNMVTCSDDACGTTQSQAFAALGYGYHYLIVSGVKGDSGTVTVHFQHAPIGNGPLVALPKGTGTVAGTTGGFDTSRTCDTSGPKNSYWWANCPGDIGGSFHASTCKGADWDTNIILQIPRLDNLSCNDDDMACGMQSTIDAQLPSGSGMFVVTVAGTLLSSFGDYALSYTRP